MINCPMGMNSKEIHNVYVSINIVYYETHHRVCLDQRAEMAASEFIKVGFGNLGIFGNSELFLQHLKITHNV